MRFKMSVIRFNRLFNSRVLPVYFRNQSTLVRNEEEYTSEPVYPEILDLSEAAIREREQNMLHEQIKAVKTVEEKQIKINMPKYYGWRPIMMNGNQTPLNCLPFVQHCTRTHLIKTKSLPDYYIAFDSAAEFMAKQLKSDVEDVIKFEYQDLRRNFNYSPKISEKRQEEQVISKSIINSINRLLTNHLASNVPHLMNAQTDKEPRHEAFWFVGGFDPYRPEPPTKKNKQLYTHSAQYIGTPTLTLRSDVPLEPIIAYSEASNESLEVPFQQLDPRTVYYKLEFRHGTNIPGFWPGDSHEFGLLSYHIRDHLVDAPTLSYVPHYISESLDAQGVLSSFGWLMAQACYQGFSTYNEITYPLTTQTVITNGKMWSFYAYQLNTVLLHNDHITKNKLRNICYGTEAVQLFEEIDKDGKLIGFNEDVLKMLIQFYLNVPTKRVNTVMKPYLGTHTKHIADIKEVKKREWLEETFKHMISNRPRHLMPYEIYQWEKIYKIRFKTRFMDGHKRPFERDENPFNRRMDEHSPRYIPKVVRPGGPKSKPKFEETYYP